MSGLKRFILFIVFFSIVTLGFVFSINNSLEVPLWIMIDLPQQRIGVWIILAFSTGGILGLLLGLGMFRSVRYKLRIRQLEMQLKRSGQAIAESRRNERSEKV